MTISNVESEKYGKMMTDYLGQFLLQLHALIDVFLAPNTWPSVAVRSVQLQLKIWNSLSRAVQSSESLDIFRRRLKTELFERSYNW